MKIGYTMMLDIIVIIAFLNFIIAAIATLVALGIYFHVVGSIQETLSFKSIRRRFT